MLYKASDGTRKTKEILTGKTGWQETGATWMHTTLTETIASVASVASFKIKST